MNKSLLDALSTEEIKEELLNPINNIPYDKKIAKLLCAKPVANVQITNNTQPQEVAAMLLNDVTKELSDSNKKKYKDILERTTLMQVAYDLNIVGDSMKNLDLKNLVKVISLDVYRDFMINANLDSIDNTVKRNAIDSIPDDISDYFEELRADVRVYTKWIMPLYIGIEKSLNYAQNITEVRNLAAANIIINTYRDKDLKYNIREMMNNGLLPPSAAFIFSALNYNYDVLNKITIKKGETK